MGLDKIHRGYNGSGSTSEKDQKKLASTKMDKPYFESCEAAAANFHETQMRHWISRWIKV